MRRIKGLLFVATLLSIAGCGGGDDSSATGSIEPANLAPTANFSFDCRGLQCKFESSSSDPDGQIESLEWDFGNGQTSNSGTGEVFYAEFGNYPVTLTVEDDDGETATQTRTVSPSKRVEVGSGVDWDAYKTEIDKYSNHYGSMPTSLNTESVWFNTLQISSEHFTSELKQLPSPERPQHGVGYGTWLNIDSERQLVFYANWVPGEPNAGSAMVLEYENGSPKSLDINRIEGATHPWVINNGDGSKQVLFPGVDEGKISINAGAAAPTHTYHVATGSWENIGVTLGAHNSIVFDYQKDGDDDLLAQNWLYGIFDGNPVILENNDGDMTPIKVQSWGYVPGMMGVAPFYYDENKLAIVYTDASVTDGYGIEPETNVIAYYAEDLQSVEEFLQLPTPYFERPVFSEVNQNIEEWEGNVGLSHDIAAKSIDIDQDGDRDIIISSMIFSDEHPFGVIQILVNKDGTYVDETDSRLFNWILSSGAAHRMHFVDINGDDYTDIILSDHGKADFEGAENIDDSLKRGGRILLNDGAGHFVTIIHQQISEEDDFYPSYVPSLDEQRKLRWTVMDANGTDNINILTRQLEMTISTGPNGIDPAAWGEPDFNEFYYLLHNEGARKAVAQGDYNNGLEHYLFEGKSQGLVTHHNQ